MEHLSSSFHPNHPSLLIVKKYKWIIVILVVVILAFIGLLIYSNRKDKKEEETPSGLVEGLEEELTGNELGETEEEGENVSESERPLVEVPEADRPSALERDKQRLADIKNIRSALLKFFNDIGNYPEKLEELVPAYVAAIPIDPKGAEAKVPYTYTPIGSLPASYYDLGYYMEVGVEGLEPIEHDATPDDLTIMQEL